MEALFQKTRSPGVLRAKLPWALVGLSLFATVAYAGIVIGQRAAHSVAVFSPASNALTRATAFNTVISKNILPSIDGRAYAGYERYRGHQRVKSVAKSDFKTLRWAATLASLRPILPATGTIAASAGVLTPIVPRPRFLPATVRLALAQARRRRAAERHCLAQAIYFEARSEPIIGQIAVGNVVFNRVKSTNYPNSICQVVFQNYKKRNACQFSFACDGIPETVHDQKSWRRAVRLARNMTSKKISFKPVRDATHYHADYVRPDWAYKLKRVKKIGRHIFYRFRHRNRSLMTASAG